jgi:proteasome lid subunit RPN8/RPN11
MATVIASELLEEILDHAAAELGAEICGLLLGRPGEITAIRPAANVAAEPVKAFELDPAVLLAAHREARAGGAAILGHYHSHPGGLAEPSACDAAVAAGEGELWLVVARGQARLWRAVRGGPVHGAFAAETMVTG